MTNTTKPERASPLKRYEFMCQTDGWDERVDASDGSYCLYEDVEPILKDVMDTLFSIAQNPEISQSRIEQMAQEAFDKLRDIVGEAPVSGAWGGT